MALKNDNENNWVLLLETAKMNLNRIQHSQKDLKFPILTLWASTIMT